MDNSISRIYKSILETSFLFQTKLYITVKLFNKMEELLILLFILSTNIARLK